MLRYFVVIILIFFSNAVFAKSQWCYQFNGTQDKAILANIATILQLDSKNCQTLEVDVISKAETTKKIQQALEPYGYFHPTINIELRATAKRWFIFTDHNKHLAIVTLTLNQPVRINAITMHITGPGKTNAVIQNYLMHLPIKVHDIYNTETYDNVKTEMYKVIRNEGYLAVTFANRIFINPKRNTATIDFNITTGEQFYFGETTFSKYIYSANFLHRIIPYTSDQHFSSKKLNALQIQMESSPFFRDVVITPNFSRIENKRVPIDIDYQVPKAKAYLVGAGYGTLSGAHLNGSLDLRRLNNEGHHFQSKLQLSSVLTGISAFYFVPGKNPLVNEWYGGAKVNTFNPNSGSSKSTTATLGYSIKSKPFSQYYTLNFLYEHFQINQLPAYTTHELYPSFKLRYLNADNLVKPQTAYMFDITLRGASHKILSTNSFAQTNMNGKIFLTPLSFAKVIMRAELGYSVISHLPNFPFSLRYFAGGQNSIRGYADSSIGPGRYLGVGSFEYQNRIYNDFFVAAFLDMGKATDHFHETRISKGAGGGLVYYSMVGPIKFYLARAITKRTQPYSFTFSIGPEFA